MFGSVTKCPGDLCIDAMPSSDSPGPRGALFLDSLGPGGRRDRRPQRRPKRPPAVSSVTVVHLDLPRTPTRVPPLPPARPAPRVAGPPPLPKLWILFPPTASEIAEMERRLPHTAISPPPKPPALVQPRLGPGPKVPPPQLVPLQHPDIRDQASAMAWRKRSRLQAFRSISCPRFASEKASSSSKKRWTPRLQQQQAAIRSCCQLSSGQRSRAPAKSES